MGWWIAGGAVALFLAMLLYACCIVSGRNRCDDCLFRPECEKKGYSCFMKEDKDGTNAGK